MHTCLPSLVAWISLRIAGPILGIMQHTQVCRVDTLIIRCKSPALCTWGLQSYRGVDFGLQAMRRMQGCSLV